MARDPQAEAAAQWLHEQCGLRRNFSRLEPRPEGAGEAFAYEVQDGLLERRLQRLPDSVGGYKIGLTTPRMQKLCNGDHPISGVMFHRGIRHSMARAATLLPARTAPRVAISDFVHLGIESELAVCLARPLDARVRPVTRELVGKAVGEMAAAFELIEDRNADYKKVDWISMAAENSWHAGLVLGPSEKPRDVSDLPGVLAIDGKEVDKGSTKDVLGHPYDAVAWLANHLGGRGAGLEAGHWISTGSIATIRFAEVGKSYRFTIEGLPPVELKVV